MNLLKKGVALTMAVITASTLGACSMGADTNWVAKYGETETVPAGVYIAGLMDGYFDVTSKLPEDTKKPLKEQVDGVAVPDLIKTGAKEALDAYIAIEKKFDELGLVLDDATKAGIAQDTEMYWSYFSETYEKNGMGKSSYIKTFTNSTKKSLIFQKIYGAGGTEEVSLDTLRPAFETDYAKIIMIPLQFSKDDAGNIQNEEKTRETIEKYFALAKDSGNMEDLQFEARKEASAEPDTLTKPAPGESYDLVNKKNSQYSDQVTTAIFDAKVGVPTVIEDEDGIYLFSRYDLTDKDLESRRTNLLAELKSEEFEEKVKTWTTELTGVTYNDKAIARYTPDKLKME